MLISQNKWITGTLLGDSSIDKHGRINISHSVKQKEYLYLKLQKMHQLKAVTDNRKPTIYSRLDKRVNNTHITYSFWTKNFFKKERNYFYPNGKKIIPSCIENYLDQESLAFWYMDDGGRNSKYGRGMVLDVSGFIQSDRELLRSILYSKWGLETSFHFRSENNVKIYIKTCSAYQFCELIRLYVIPQMKYKLTC